jgi:alpha-mannosidase
MMIRILALTLWICIAAAAQPVTLYMIPNTHGTVSGWLVDFDMERNYVLNNYLAHLDRVKKDDTYSLAYSEVPNVISFLQFAKERVPELKQLQARKRIEFSNGFFLEPDINLSGGEALVQMGVHGLRWYEEVFGFRPRHCWMIDITGAHRQMPQIVTGLGMDSIFFNRNNPARNAAFWWVAPDGTRALALANRTYMEFGGNGSLFGSKEPLTSEQFAAMYKSIAAKREYSPSKTALFSLTGHGDYSSPPLREAYPAEFLREWSRRYPDVKIRFTIPSEYVDALTAEIKSGQTTLQEYTGDTGYSWDSFWMNMPEVKQYYRKDEHLLQAAEALATVASIRGKLRYPSQEFYYSWINMLMNMDRNTIWGASAGMAFKDPKHWDAWDRYESVERQAQGTLQTSLRALAGNGAAVALFNPLNWARQDPVTLKLPSGQTLDGAVCESIPGESDLAICRPSLPSLGTASFRLKPGASPVPQPVALPELIETPYYMARVDPRTGALTSLKTKATGIELLGGPANVVMAETVAGMKVDAAHFMHPRPKRRQLGTNSDYPATIQVLRGPLSTRVQIVSDFHGGSKLRRTIIFYRDHPRIDFETRVDLRADDVLVSVDVPLAGGVVERSRGIPYGYSAADLRQTSVASADQRQPGSDPGSGGAILPCIRWSNYQMASGDGLALLDRGLTAHELNGSTLTLTLVNGVSQYLKKPNEMLRGQGVRDFSYALVPHSGSWQQAGIARLAYEFNSPPPMAAGAGTRQPESLVETSGNVIVEAMRRVGRQIEIRLYETDGRPGKASLTLRLPHRKAAMTNMMGEKPQALAGGPVYEFPIRPQQIVTLRFDVNSAVATPAAVRDWSVMVPPAKRAPLTVRILEAGHPGR